MSPAARKLLLTAHVGVSAGWIGALAVFFAHALASVVSDNANVVRAAALAMGLTAWYVIMPLAAATVVSGVAQALGSAWGLVRHYWVAFKLVLTLLATAVLLLKMAPIIRLADAARQDGFSAADLPDLRASLALHAAGGLVVLVMALVLAIYKPTGRIGIGLPRWAKALAGGLALLGAALAAMVLLGGHGPGTH
jgi:hypothetical protein